MVAAPPEQTLEWSDEGVQGAYRFIKRLWRAVYEHVTDSAQAGAHSAAGAVGVAAAAPNRGAGEEARRAMRRQAHQTLAKVTDDIGRRRTFNTAIAAVMELLNALAKFAPVCPEDARVRQEALEIAVIALAPIVPHVTHALWLALGHTTALVDERWPEVDASALSQATQEIVVQVNGKLRGRIAVPVGADEATVRAAALADPHVQKFIAGAAVRKIIVVPGKLVSLVV
jgi:leucyl-tRNA synthetase